MEDQQTVVIDPKAVDRLLKKIILLEKKNLKTKELGYGPIVKKIKKMIEEEAECY
ncbi:MAG: hypothetical protein H8D34_20350 [Chloroflexi bacterium]|nr:hypothetical protein [Chloroflexota bacterium]